MELVEAIDQIEDLIVEGEQQDANAALDAAMQTFGNAPELLVLRTELALDEEDYVGAVLSADQAAEKVDDDEWRARLFAAKAYAQFYDDQPEDARETFNTAVGFDSELLNALTGRAMVHEHLGFVNAALLDLDRVIEQDDQDGQPFAIRASIHMRMGNFEIAEADLFHAIQMEPDDEESRLQVSRIHALMQRTHQAMEMLEPLVEGGESIEYVGPATILRSQLSLSQNAHDAAISDATRAIELMPDEPWGYLQHAAAIIAQGADAGPAIELLKVAESKVSTTRDLPDLYALRAAAYEVMGKNEKAQEIRDDAEGVARLPAYVYGSLNPAVDVPSNPNKPIDIRALLEDLFGDVENAPPEYEGILREVVAKIPEIVEEHPGVGKIHVDLPESPNMVGGKRQLVINLGKK